MKTLTKIIGLLALIVMGTAVNAASFISVGDGGWEFVKPTPSVQDWHRVFFLDDKTGWAVGLDCAILKTTDGGKNWAPQGPRIRKVLNDIVFTDKNHGWAVGSSYANPDDKIGIILKTSDGGVTWRKVLDGGTDGLKAVCFVNNSVGWAVGGFPSDKGVILKSTDGGETWLEQNPGPAKAYRSFSGVAFVDENTGWVTTGSRGIYHTTDGGKTWSVSTAPGKGGIGGIQFLDANEGWLISRNMLHTTDGGATWAEISLDKLIPAEQKYAANRSLESFHFADKMNGLVITYGGKILHTSDGGKTWELAKSLPSEIVSRPRVFMADAKNGWAGGYNGQMMRTCDGGVTWESLSWGRDDYTGQLTSVGNKFLWAAGSVENSRGPAGVLLRSRDGGATWSRHLIEGVERLGASFFIDENKGWATATGSGMVYRTTDGGETWTSHKVPAVVSTAVFFVDAMNGWVAGQNGAIVRTGDGGTTWTKLDSGTMDQLMDVHFLDRDTGWVCGENGRMMKTTDGGRTWKRQGTGTTNILASVCFVNDRVGWASGTQGIIVKTTDGGETWAKQNSGKKEQLTGIYFINGNEGWAAGLGTTMVHTVDGGQTWTAQDYGTWNGLFDVRFTDSNNGVAVGGPIVLRTTTGGLPGAVWAKKQADGAPANFGHLVGTKKSQGYLLAEHPDSRVGIHIKTSDDKPAVGDYIYVHGKIATENGEKIIAADSIDIMCAGWGVLPEKK